MFESWFTLIKISFGIAILWMILELLFRPLINRHAKNQMVESARKCYFVLLAGKGTYKLTGEIDDPREIIYSLNEYRDMIGKNPRLSKKTGHAEIYRKIRKTVSGRDWAAIDDLLDDLEKLDGSIDDRAIDV